MLTSPEKKIQSGYLTAEKITKKYAKNFYFASLFLSKEKRNSAYAIYAICRISDEATDRDASLLELSEVKRNIDTAYENAQVNTNILLAFQETINRYSIPKQYFEELIEGMYTDFRQLRYNDFAELKEYCYRVAGVVGLMILKIFGYNNSAAENSAVSLGIAMQLTNILRDIKEDCQRGRIYLPQEEMASFGVTENDIVSGSVNENFKSLLKFQISRAKRFYRDSENGFPMITDARARFVAKLMKEIYLGVIEQVEKNDYDVFSQRAYVGLGGQLSRTFRVLKRIFRS